MSRRMCFDMAELLDLLAPLPSPCEMNTEVLLQELGIRIDQPEKIWE